MELPIGFDDFGKVRANNLKFVDKTLFIKEVLDNRHIEVSIITRPRRFGKTLNLSTLHHFLAAEVNQQKTAGMFADLKIAAVDNGAYMQYQGQYPVIFVSFKDAKGNTAQKIFRAIQLVMQKLYRAHNYLLNSAQLSPNDKELFNTFLTGAADKITLTKALEILCELLAKHIKKKVFLLIDEYDTPIQSGYLHGYYNEITDFMRGMFGAALKTNPYLDRAVITGILRVAKESLFSGLNNVVVYSLLNPKYSQYFGFTETEVNELLKQANLSEQEPKVRAWYNGYVFGKTVVYNPWSIVNYFVNNGSLQPYWVNTSDNNLIKTLLLESNTEFKAKFELLLREETVTAVIDENVVFGDLKQNNRAIWSLLLMSGYLKSLATTNDMGNIICQCAIPNFEVKTLYCNIIKDWLSNGDGIIWYQNFLTHLLQGDIKEFVADFGQILAQTVSFHDVAHNPEAFYHGFMLGLAAGVDQKQYEVKSNRESGVGRYDIAIIPKDTLKPAIILEIKSVTPSKLSKRKSATVLQKEAQTALAQIDSNQYTTELVQRGITNIVKIGLAFAGKEFRVATE